MNQPLLHFLATKNYKNLCSEQLFYLSNLNIFIGSNGSGKSNFISCLKFLKNCLINIPEENQGVSSFEDAISKIGGTRILDSSVSSPAKVNLYYCFSQISQTNNPQRDSVVFDLQLYTDRRETWATVSEEYLYGGEDLHDHANSDPFYYYKLHNRELGKGVVSVYDKPGQYYPTHFESLDNISTKSLGLSSITKILENSQSPPENTPIYKIRRELIELVSKWHFYNANNMDLNQIRTAEPKLGQSDIYLSPSGDNLALVLDNLYNKNIDFEESLNLAMKSILPKSRRIRPIRSGRLSLTVEWHFQDTNEPFFLNEMSDGTVRMLCWATILHSPVLPSFLVIDEPELGLHVAWMPILAEWIKQASQKTQVIITTHSPDLLDHFTDCLESVSYFHSTDQNHFSIKPLSREILEPKLTQGWELGDLYRVGDPSLGGWPW